MLQEKWRITLLNGLAMHQGSQTIQRFRTQKTGELLPGCYGDWILPERERLNQSYLYLLRDVIGGLWKGGEKEQALEYARCLIAADPLREEAYLLLMRLYAASGRPTDALRCFQNCKRLLAEELCETPSPAMTNLARKRCRSRTHQPAHRPRLAAQSVGAAGDACRHGSLLRPHFRASPV